MTKNETQLEEIVRKLKDRNLKKVADSLPISYMTVWRISTGRQKSPVLKTMNILSDYLKD